MSCAVCGAAGYRGTHKCNVNARAVLVYLRFGRVCVCKALLFSCCSGAVRRIRSVLYRCHNCTGAERIGLVKGVCAHVVFSWRHMAWYGCTYMRIYLNQTGVHYVNGPPAISYSIRPNKTDTHTDTKLTESRLADTTPHTHTHTTT